MVQGQRRGQLTAERVLQAAESIADEIGFDSLTIRAISAELGVKPMTIYHYFDSKEAIIDGMVERVFLQLVPPPTDIPWREALRVRCQSVREVLNRHSWAAPLMESRTSPGPASLKHHDSVLACLRRGGLSWALTAHAYATLDSFIFGFAFEEGTLPATSGPEMTELASDIAAGFPEGLYPTLAAFTQEHVLREGYSFGASFDFGLELILDAITRAAEQERNSEAAGL